MTKKTFAFLLVSALLAACSVEATKTISPSATQPPPSVTATCSVCPTCPPTLTPLPPTSTATPAPTLTPTVTGTPTVSPEIMRYQCLEIGQLPSDFTLEGELVFNTDGNLDAFLYRTGRSYRFPREEGDRLHGFEVSPDRTRIMYYHAGESGNWKLVIATAEGQPIWSEDIPLSGWDWIDDEHILGEWVKQDELPNLVLLNPFSGERQEFRPDYPDFAVDYLEDVRWRGGAVKYDPTLTRVVYPECDAECIDWHIHKGIPGWPVVLWDLEKGQVLARLMTMDSFGETPIWSPDGKQFVMATNLDSTARYFMPANEFYAVSRDGQVRQLTHFMDYFESVKIYNYSLSPDGRFAAVWMLTRPSPYDDERLVVVNTETGEATNYCITGDPFLDNAVGPESVLAPIWSPDSTQLLIVQRDPQDSSRRWTILVDIVRGYASHMGENVQPVGWMVAP